MRRCSSFQGCGWIRGGCQSTAGAAAYSSSVTAASQCTTAWSASPSLMARWNMSRSGAAPCQGSSSAPKQDAVAGADDLDRAAPALAQAESLGDEDGLAQRVAVPVGARAGHEVHQVGADPGRRGCGGDGVDVDVAGEPVGGTLDGGDR